MAEYLKAYAAVKVFIVGRSHNQGTLARNLQLSQPRAAAVVAAPRTWHGIDAARLSARGAAKFAPVATNSSLERRARNRRVEMVSQ
jgi:outer membrane protein OmpA-like peptidoglycan-associated protein